MATTEHQSPEVRFLRLKEVIAQVGLKKSSLYAMAARGDFPRPTQLGPRAVAWPNTVISAWIADRIANGPKA